MTLKLAKCTFFTDEVRYLGHVIRPGTLSVDEIDTKALREVAIPRTQSELRSFLGLCNVYRRFVPNYAHIAAPLHALLQKGRPDKLEPFQEAQTEAFETLKAAVEKAMGDLQEVAEMAKTANEDAFGIIKARADEVMAEIKDATEKYVN